METYIQLLRLHDWTFEFSDDQRVWSAGRAERQIIDDMRKSLDKDYTVWNQHAPPHFVRV